MKRVSRSISAREVILVAVTIMVVLGFFGYRRFLLPKYDEWRHLREQVELQAGAYERLRANLAMRQSVEAEFARIGPSATQHESDQATLAKFLRELETLARHPNMTVVNMKPMPVRREGGHQVYPVKLAVSAKLQEVLEFVSQTLNAPDTVIGLESFSLRGAQGGQLVECSLALWMVRLLPEPKAATAAAAVKLTPSTRSSQEVKREAAEHRNSSR